MNKVGYIYLTTNLINGKKYIGQHRAKEFDEYYKGSGVHIKNAINKYGRENFDCIILEWCYSEEELNTKEIYWIAKYQACSSEDFYNIMCGGAAGGRIKGHIVSEETREKLRNANLGKTVTEETRNKISKALKGKNTGDNNGARKPGMREKFKQLNSGCNNPIYGKHWYTNGTESILTDICPDGFYPGRKMRR